MSNTITSLPPCRVTEQGCSVSFDSLAGERFVTVEPQSGDAVADIVLVHGLSDHPARYIENARWLAGRGYRTVLFELVGHGGQASNWPRSFWISDIYRRHGRADDVLRALRADPRFTPARNCDLVRSQYSRLAKSTVDDHLRQVGNVIENLPRLIGGDRRRPLFLVGHSMGGLLVTETVWRLAERGGPTVSGAVLLCPAFKPQGNPDSTGQSLVIDAMWGLRRAPISFARGAFKRTLNLNLPVDANWGNKWMSDQQDEFELFETDPLIPHVLPTRYASSIESQMARTERRGPRFPVPGLMMVPGRDGITSRKAGVDFARRAIAAVGRDRFRLASFDRVCAHDLLRSSVREETREILANWLDEQVKGRRVDFAA